jgi:glutaredoxin-related protein
MLINEAHISNNIVVVFMEATPKQLRCVFSVIAVKASIAKTCSTLFNTSNSLIAEILPILTWSSCPKHDGIESTDAG